MALLEMLRRESTVSQTKMSFISALSGLSNALILALINLSIESAAQYNLHFRHLFLFLVVLSLFIVTRRYVAIHATTELQAVLHKVRVRLADKIRHADLEPLEKIGRSDLYSSVNRETDTISQAGRPMQQAFQSAILFFFTLIYIALISFIAFILFCVLIWVSAAIYLRRKRAIRNEMYGALESENKLFDSLTHVLDGFKEIKINTARSDDVFHHIIQRSNIARGLKSRVEIEFALLSLFSIVSFYGGLAVVVFLLPTLNPEYSQVVVKVTTAVLFIIGPIFTIIGAVPDIANAQVAAQTIANVEEELDRAAYYRTVPGPAFDSSQEIVLDGVVFQFDESSGRPFSVGPIDLTVKAGEILFIAGGNGSGKSTLLKLLTALYYPQKGTIRIDGTTLGESTYTAYRNLFSVIFSDYHLFDRIYGLGEVDPARVHEWLKVLEIEDKTSFVNGEFTNLDLSTGQRKRLALLVSMLENKSIYVFDEWAADQDPVFRRRFYRELLPGLKSRGKTVIAVTHDDSYYDAADRLLMMKDGRLVHLEREPQ
ncbi:MAG TPA: cyclic peptide export ABC transporter [Thermoanaerobaculia bacterium]|jgi:putative ATP-binding cassette transporter|nr:cyclic peptide export ABC transporter [Thermoanaerobaculia bacterium]